MDRNSESILVESRYVGRIIGSRGSKIREMQDISNAKIQVSREEASDGRTSVEISGTEEQIAKAKLLIDECQTSDYRGGSGYSSRGGYGGGGGGGGGGYSRGGRRDYNNRDDGGRDSWRDRGSYGQDDRGDSRRGYGGDRSGGGRGGYDRNDGGWGGRGNDRNDRSRDDRY